jgi:hypothetical protein
MGSVTLGRKLRAPWFSLLFSGKLSLAEPFTKAMYLSLVLPMSTKCHLRCVS